MKKTLYLYLFFIICLTAVYKEAFADDTLVIPNTPVAVASISDWNPTDKYNVRIKILTNGNSGNTLYLILRLDLAGGTTLQTWTHHSDSDVVVDPDLNPNSTYTYMIKARRAYESPYSAPSSSTTAPSLVPDSKWISVSTTTITWQWGQVAEATSYKVYSSTLGFLTAQAPSGAGPYTWKQTGLIPGSLYSFLIRAANQFGQGQYLTTITTSTYAQVPGTPEVTSFNNVVHSTNSIFVSFGNSANSAMTQYLIKTLANSNTYYVQADGKLGTGKVWQTYSQWGADTYRGYGAKGILVNYLDPGTNYRFTVKARNSYNIETNYSAQVSTDTRTQYPDPVLIDVTTDTIKVMIDVHKNYINNTYNTYCFKIKPHGQNTKYLNANGTLGDSEVWYTTKTWGGCMVDGVVQGASTGTVIRLPLPANRYYTVTLGAKTKNVLTSNYLLGFSTFTRPFQPNISLQSVTTGAINLGFSNLYTMNSSSFTKYYVKAVLADGTTQYLQQNQTLASALFLQTTTQWVNNQWNNNIKLQSLVSNMGFNIQVAAQNGFGMPENSINISTWTLLARPAVPHAYAGWDPNNHNSIQVDINTNDPNSVFTKYAIIRDDGSNNYFKGDGSLSANFTDAKFYTRQEWITAGRNILNFINTTNQPYTFKLQAWSDAQQSHTKDPYFISSSTQVHSSPQQPGFAPSLSVINNNYIRIAWAPTADASYMAIYYSTKNYSPYYIDGFNSLHYINRAANQSIPELDYYNYHINGSTPLPVNDFSLQTYTSSITINWQSIANPAASPILYFAIKGVNSEGAEGQPSELSSEVNVQPLINGYKIYADTFSRVITDINDLTSTFAGLLPNKKYTYKLSALTTQNLESAPVTFSTYTFAAAVTNLKSKTNWNPDLKFFNTITYDLNNNPVNTEFAVQADNLMWLDGTGNAGSLAPVWLSSTSWQHNYLKVSTSYRYNVYVRNAYHIITSSSAVVNQKTLKFAIPVLSAIRCKYSPADTRPVKNGGSSNSSTPSFSWDVLYTSFPITSYFLSWSTAPAATPNISVSTANTCFNPVIVFEPNDQKQYYLKVMAQDNQNQWSDITSFNYYFCDDRTPFSIPQQINIGGVPFNGLDYGVPLSAQIKLDFKKVISTDTLPNNIYFQALSNETEDAISQKLDPALSFDTTITTATFVTLSTNFTSNWTYDLVISTSVRDRAWNVLDTEYRKRFRAIIAKDAQVTNRVSILKTLGEKATVAIAPGSLPQDAYILMNGNPDTNPQKVSKSIFDKAQSKINDKNRPSWYVETNMYDSNYQQIFSSQTLLSPVPLTMTYLDNDNNGMVDGTCLRVDSLSLWWLDEAKQLWSKVPSTIDKSNKIVTARVSHLSVYALFGALNLSVDDVIVAPVPWVPELGDVAKGTLAGGITFRNLPYQGEIRIYTVSGELVRKIDLNSFIDPNGYAWDGKNGDGKYVASGVYLWVVRSDQGKKTGKLIVIR
ncbi:MAG: hypothetical protein LHV68_00620 [Elusimicrobia bacterium]|nr:hypothetical protein [Candidatus Liberimonas magnetica]